MTERNFQHQPTTRFGERVQRFSTPVCAFVSNAAFGGKRMRVLLKIILILLMSGLQGLCKLVVIGECIDILYTMVKNEICATDWSDRHGGTLSAVP